jgi:hypothetical protein
LTSASRSMDVQVHYKRGQRRLQATRPSLLGNGILERARSTSLGLLGLTAAVGLAIVALALNQGWPLVAGGPIPVIGAEHQAVGGATVVAAAQSGGLASRGATGPQSSKASARPRRRGAGGTMAPTGSRSHGAEGVVVSHATAGRPPREGSPNSATPTPAPVGEQPTATPAPAPSSPAVAPPSPAPPPTSDPPASHPVLASVGGNEHGHDRHRGGDGSRGHGRPKGGDDTDTVRSEPESDSAPSSSQTPSPSGESPDDQDSSESHSPPWSHGRDRGHGHDYGDR